MKICIATAFLAAAVFAAPKHQHEALDMKLCEALMTPSYNKTNGTYRNVDMRSYKEGVELLESSNRYFNRYNYIHGLDDGTIHDSKEEQEIIQGLGNSNSIRYSQYKGYIDAAKKQFSSAFSPEDYCKVEQAIEEARGKLGKSWKKIEEIDINQLSNLDKLFRGEKQE